LAGPNRTYTLYSGTQVVSEFSDASTATYTSGATPGQAPSDSVSLLLYQHHDHMNTRVATDQQGNVAYQRGNYPYGDQWYDTGAASPSVARKLTKYRLEPELTGSFVNHALYREHSARMGRFHTPDRRSGSSYNPQRLNRYSYASDDPINRWDPNGLIDFVCVDDCDDYDSGFGINVGTAGGWDGSVDSGGGGGGLPPAGPDPCDPVTGMGCGPNPQPCDTSTDPTCTPTPQPCDPVTGIGCGPNPVTPPDPVNPPNCAPGDPSCGPVGTGGGILSIGAGTLNRECYEKCAAFCIEVFWEQPELMIGCMVGCFIACSE